MEIEPGLLEKLKSENHEFRRLHEEHTSLKSRVEELNKLKFLTSDQELEKKTIQKEKLIKKDRMDEILSEYQGFLH